MCERPVQPARRHGGGRTLRRQSRKCTLRPASNMMSGTLMISPNRHEDTSGWCAHASGCPDVSRAMPPSQLKLMLKESGREKKRSRTILRVNLARAPLSSCPNTFSSLILNGTCPHRRYGSAKHVQWTCPMARVSALGCSGSALSPQVGSGCCHRTVGRG